MIPPWQRYLQKRRLAGPWSLEGAEQDDFSLAVVIPALGESRSLPATLASLERNPPNLLERTLVTVVVNNPAQASQADREDNRRTLAGLARYAGPLHLAWVNASSQGRELPPREGVGTARKIGFDLVLGRCRAVSPLLPILISLDADTLVDDNYLPAIEDHFRDSAAGGAVLPFCHRSGGDPAIDRAIGHYELFLRTYVLGLTWAASPYALHTIGSAMACRADAYAACGGMNRRPSGEDFYFVQQLAKVCGVSQVRGTLVHPSPRPSSRVPFGTGPSVARLLAHPGEELEFYPAAAFDILKEWLAVVSLHRAEKGEALLERARGISPDLGRFLEALDFTATWRKLQRNHAQPERLSAAFHAWFDGLRTRQLLHNLARGPFPWQRAAQAVPALLQRLSLPSPSDPQEQLELLRLCQTAGFSPETAGNIATINAF
jgi:hypothetical protein